MTTPHFLPDIGFLQQPSVQRLLSVLNAPHDRGLTRIVGGAVRNALMGLSIGDIDCATMLTPQDVMERAQQAGFRCVPTGLRFGTVTVVVEGTPFEVTTLRRDVATDGRWAEVVFGSDFDEDARRRDFTINALYCDGDGRLYDPLGGYDDVMACHVRFIGDPATRLREDYLRVLRFFRFHACFGQGPIDRDGFWACVAARTHIRQLSNERVRQELLKLLVAPSAYEALQALSETGVLIDLVGVPMMGTFERLSRLENARYLKSGAITRLAALAVRIPDDVERLAKRLRLSRAEEKTLLTIAQWSNVIARCPERRLCRRMLEAVKEAHYVGVLLNAWARTNAEADAVGWTDLADLPNHDPIAAFPLNGADIQAFGISDGLAIGQALTHARNAWVASDFRLGREALLALVTAPRIAKD